MKNSFESKMSHDGNHGRSAARIVLALGLATMLCVAFSEKAFSAPKTVNAPGACCVTVGQFQTCSHAVYTAGLYTCNGVYSHVPFGGSCSIQACNLPDGSCVDVDAMCRCPSLGGTPQGSGTTCPPPPVPTEACCGLNAPADFGSCAPNMVPADCRNAGGEPAGAGTDCSISGTPPLEYDVCSVLRACCGSTTQACGNYTLFMCVNDGGTPQSIGTNCSGDADGDLIANVCDNCPYDANGSQVNSDTDGVGDVCDNCPLTNNDSQADTDEDGVGDNCDNCTNTPNGRGGFCVVGLQPASCVINADCDSGSSLGTCSTVSGTCTSGDTTVANCTYNAQCDTCPNLGDGICSTNQENCDGDSAGDVCDGDIDGDTVNNADDLCDFTPVGTTVETAAGSPFRGTLRADLDGDCDVDITDRNLLLNDYTGVQSCITNNANVEDPLCGATITCPPTGGGGGPFNDTASNDQTSSSQGGTAQ